MIERIAKIEREVKLLWLSVAAVNVLAVLAHLGIVYAIRLCQ